MHRNVEIFSGPNCPYCVRAKALLARKGVAFVEYDVKSDPAMQLEMLRRVPQARTIPQIFIDGRHVGGCDDLYALEGRGELDRWLQG